MDNKDTGILLNEKDIKLQRIYFKQMCQLLGIRALFRAPIDDAKAYNDYADKEEERIQKEMMNKAFKSIKKG